MNNTAKEPSSAPLASKVSPKSTKELKTKRRNGLQEPSSDPTGNGLRSRDINSLSEDQLRKLTKANTRKNHGGRSSRLRSQVERVFRRLDNLAADVKLQPRYSIDALPVVSPGGSSDTPQNECTHFKECELEADKTSNSDQEGITATSDCQEKRIDEPTVKSAPTKPSYGAEKDIDPIPLDNDEFEIEPATNNLAFVDYSSSPRAPSESTRSVRISTSVTILDYKPSQPVSIARQLQRYEHPTRTGRSLQARKYLAEGMDGFPRAMQRLDQLRETDKHQANEIRKGNSAQENMSPRAQRASPPSPQRARSGGSSPTSFIVPSPVGPYGSRSKRTEE